MDRMNGYRVNPPQWVLDILRKYQPETYRNGMAVDCRIWLPLVKLERSWEYAHYDPQDHCIEMAWSRMLTGGVSQVPTMDRLWTVLHELAHAIHRVKTGVWSHNEEKKRLGKRRLTHHPAEFWTIAIRLFEDYPGVMEYAVKREYQCGRKLIQKRLIELAYEKRHPQCAE